MLFKDYNETPVVTCLELCRSIELSFEMSCPELFEIYKKDRLHGHDHVWNVLENSLIISSKVKAFMELDNLEIDYEHLIAACLLHDTAGLVIDVNERVNHHINAKKYIEIILNHYNASNHFKLDIDRVYTIARAHRLRAQFPPQTLAEEIIALADSLDENMNRLYHGNKHIRPFFNESLSSEHRIKVLMRRNLENEGISREDPRNDALMFMLDSLIRNSINFNPWKLVINEGQREILYITDDCWQIIAKDYFETNYALLMQLLIKDNVKHLALYINNFLNEVSNIPNFSFLKLMKWPTSHAKKYSN